MIEIKDLKFGYRQQIDLFYNLNLQVKSGVICGLLGKNGAGKTSLLKLISGLLFPHNGQIFIGKQPPLRRLPAFLQDIYFVAEDVFVPNIAIKTYLKLYSTFYPKFNHEQFEQYIKEFELNINSKLNNLSYGQKKKFLLAFGLASNCRLVLLDEPTNGLDIPSKMQFRRLLASAISDDKSIIISTHQARDLQNILDTIIILDEGEIVLNHTLNNIAKKLTFQQQIKQPSKNDANLFYYEKILTDYIIVNIVNNVQDVYASDEIDLEILFNAVTSNKIKTKDLFREV